MKNKFLILVFIFIIKLNAQNGCTDPLANNYNSSATTNDGSCTYNASSVSVSQSFNLSATISETSGLIEWNNHLYTHNDDSNTNLYKLNKVDGSILQTIPINNVFNIDWEEISQDQDYVYIGDFGNNATGNRTNLKIYKILKSSLSTTPIVETINFSYSNQTDFSQQTSNNTNFDCEAFVVTNNEILLFTKQWLDNKTTIYSIPKNTGTHIANQITTIDVGGLITGATLMENYNLITLSGYSSATLSPFVYLIYGYSGTNFQMANKRKISINLTAHQVEAISSTNGLDYFITNENFVFAPFVNNPQKLHTLSLSSFTSNYINNLSLQNTLKLNKISVFPNPASNEININVNNSDNISYNIYDVFGRIVLKNQLKNQKINLESLNPGMYFIEFLNTNEIIKIIKI